MASTVPVAMMWESEIILAEATDNHGTLRIFLSQNGLLLTAKTQQGTPLATFLQMT